MHKPVLFLAPLLIIAANALAGSSADDAALARSHQLQLEFRQGDLAAVKPLVQTLEAAVARSQKNAKLWEAMGHAYMAQLGTLFAGPPDIPTLITTGERARDAYSRSLALDGHSILVRASHGMSTMVVSQLKGDGPGMAAGIEEMNAAVRDAPNSVAARLTRGFTIIHLPPEMRDNDAVTQDLKFILDTSPEPRREDVLHVLLGDVYAELGKVDDARGEYRLVTGASAFAAAQAKTRMTDLDKGKGPISREAITQVRSGTGTRCAMCHAPGTDN